MSFERLSEWPGLVLDTVLLFLPTVYQCVLSRSSDHELCALAAARSWTLVYVERPGASRSTSDRLRRRLTHDEFETMLRTDSLPCRIGHLFFSAAHVSPEQLTPEWEAWVRSNTRSFGMAIATGSWGDGHGAWRAAVRRLTALNLTELRVEFYDDAPLHRSPLPFTFPPTLRTLRLTSSHGSTSSLSLLEIPQSVVDLRLGGRTQLLHLPVLPRRLRTLVVERKNLDISLDVSLFPPLLETLLMGLTRDVPATVSSAAFQWFLPQLQHNMVVYTGSPPLLRGLRLDWDTPFPPVYIIDMMANPDYGRMQLPPGTHLRIDSAWNSRLMPLRSINHWLPALLDLSISLPLDLDGAVVPPGLRVRISGSQRATIPPQLWDISWVVLMEVCIDGDVAIAQQIHRLRHLTRLSLDARSTISEVFTSPPRLQSIQLMLGKNCALPDFRACKLTRKLTVAFAGKASSLKWSHVPPGLTLMEMHGRTFRGECTSLVDAMLLQHLVGLDSLLVENMQALDLGLVRLPSSLATLRCTRIGDFVLKEGCFPPRLSRLAITHTHSLANPWSVPKGPFRRRQVLEYPETLRDLDLGMNGGLLVPPPREFVFPPELATLSVAYCGIGDVTRWRFPTSLTRLDALGNIFPILAGYEWPAVEHLSVQRLAGGKLSAMEQAELRRQLPGARVDW